jgi:hypothetical protein
MYVLGHMAKWKFKVVLDDLNGFFIRRKDGTDHLEGTSEEALAFAHQVREFYSGKPVARVEAHSNGSVQADCLSAHKNFTIRRHLNGRDWWVNETDLTHPGWFRNLEHAVSHLAFRGRGYVCQIQVLKPSETEVILIDQKGDDSFAGKGPTYVPSAIVGSSSPNIDDVIFHNGVARQLPKSGPSSSQ